MLGSKLRELREQTGLMQRQVSAHLEIDTGLVSKMENEQKPVSKDHLPLLASLFRVPLAELEVLWLADRIERLAENEPHFEQAITLLSSKNQK
ncbi:MAG: helix-turn-helix domain-containing protein [Bacteroidia bacterium]|nr:helix-turn-helix domain-containing protein [Bacteroidia bacterium]